MAIDTDMSNVFGTASAFDTLDSVGASLALAELANSTIIQEEAALAIHAFDNIPEVNHRPAVEQSTVCTP